MSRRDLIPPSPAEHDYAAASPEVELAPPERPLELFADWLAEARAKEHNDPNAMCLATVDADGLPDARMVLLKDFDEAGFVFFTNLESAKGRQLAAQPKAALLFHWKSLRRQVRLRGPVAPVTPDEADAYFATRARSAQIGAWASAQSRLLESRHALEKAVADHGLRFGLGAVPRPPHWSGFRLSPLAIEFWRDRPFRLHERILYARGAGEGAWAVSRLYP
ncbi:MAG TPA: pyridoxamine 5'-phosphate oxidase [Caulobacteraceae bacterium]|jgi:pyridoxamine 5'-phosphate oxidase